MSKKEKKSSVCQVSLCLKEQKLWRPAGNISNSRHPLLGYKWQQPQKWPLKINGLHRNIVCKAIRKVNSRFKNQAHLASYFSLSSFCLSNRYYHSMARANLNTIENFMTNTTTASKYIPKRFKICINRNPPFQTLLHKIFKNCFLWSKSCFTMFTFRGTFTK